ncbi:hypothetical protein ACFVGM_16230 [Kitasatospora purpeofusca]|uniref:hypothetical protein n=1 Tax=Kitasatospora purpeofusca TaxID=67352 RepID=UPI0036ACC991
MKFIVESNAPIPGRHFRKWMGSGVSKGADMEIDEVAERIATAGSSAEVMPGFLSRGRVEGVPIAVT